MSNRPLWDIRKRHVWIANPTKSPALKLRARKRNGVQAAIERQAPKQSGEAPAEPAAG